MVDKCSFSAVQDDFILAHTECKEMDLCPIRAFFPKKPSFLTNFYLTKMSLVLRVGLLLKKVTPIGHTE